MRMHRPLRVACSRLCDRRLLASLGVNSRPRNLQEKIIAESKKAHQDQHAAH
jgi:hypothetical protein